MRQLWRPCLLLGHRLMQVLLLRQRELLWRLLRERLLLLYILLLLLQELLLGMQWQMLLLLRLRWLPLRLLQRLLVRIMHLLLHLLLHRLWRMRRQRVQRWRLLGCLRCAHGHWLSIPRWWRRPASCSATPLWRRAATRKPSQLRPRRPWWPPLQWWAH